MRWIFSWQRTPRMNTDPTASIRAHQFIRELPLGVLMFSVFSHRVVLNARFSSTLKKSEQAEQIIRDLVESVAVPI